MANPLLLKFAKRCLSPNRASNSEEYEYDESVDMVRARLKPGKPFAIDIDDATGPMTKKADLEKGEDNKDHYMW